MRTRVPETVRSARGDASHARPSPPLRCRRHRERAPGEPELPAIAAARGPPPPPPPPRAPSPPVHATVDILTGSLVHLGLSVHEAQMYRSLAESGPSTARQAIERSRLDRATGYRILSRLRARGLVSASGYRPQRCQALDATKLVDRVTTFWRDELELHRLFRDICQFGLSGPHPAAEPPAVPGAPARASPSEKYRLVPGHD